jgi:mannose-1-phosphate guanylyltransferase
MKAIVLVGGEGTRLRPLTETIPKPLIPLVDRPFLDHLLDHLAGAGVDEVRCSSPYLESSFHAFLEARRGHPAVRWIREETPLGTGGAVAHAARGLRDPFLVCNGDILTDLDLGALAAFHRGHGAAATIALTPVTDARPFGLVERTDDGRVLAFREKPSEPVAGLVNAGTYLLDPSVVRDVAVDRAVSIEREVFPPLIASGRPVFGFVSDAYWIDLGTPEKYLQATFDALEGLVHGLSYPAPFVHPSADVALRSHLGRWVVVGPGVRIGPDAEVEDSVLLARARVEAGARVRGSIVGMDATVGEGATVSDTTLAEGAVVPPGDEVRSARTSPGRRLDRPPAATG